CAPGRRVLLGLERLDPRRCRTAPQRRLQPLNRLDLPFHEHLDAAVGQVAHPAVRALARRCIVREPPAPDALHTSANHVPSRDLHCIPVLRVLRVFRGETVFRGHDYSVPRSTEISMTPTGSSCATKSVSGSSDNASRSTGRYGRSWSVSEICAISW